MADPNNTRDPYPDLTTMATKSRPWNENFARFFESPSREGLRDVLQNHSGEANTLDFKKDWPAFSKVARHILAFANSGGGALIFGVDEKANKSFESAGLTAIKDKADVKKGVSHFLPAQLEYDVLDFTYSESEYPAIVGKQFQVLIIEDLPKYGPFVSLAAGEGIDRDVIYVRRGTNSERANHSELQQVINRRIETTYSSQSENDLVRHLAELSALYEHLPRYPSMIEQLAGLPMNAEIKASKEDLRVFLKGLIARKKAIIEKIAMRL